MRVLVDKGTAPAEAARMVRAALPPLAPTAAESEATDDALAVVRARLIAAAQRFDVTAIDEELTKVFVLLDVQTLYERLISPLVVEVGELWRSERIGIAQEHLLSERLELALRGTLRSMERLDGPLVLLGCIDGEQHVLGLLGAALRFAHNGARVVVLGALNPPDAIADAVRGLGPKMVGLSLTLPPPSARSLFRAYAKACAGVPWVVGGPGVAPLASIVRQAGGLVASGPSSAWQTNIRDWLRGIR